jgi:hypothetical protein
MKQEDSKEKETESLKYGEWEKFKKNILIKINKYYFKLYLL